MKTKFTLSILLGLVAGSLGFASSAQAFSFTTNYTYALDGKDAPRGDIWLDSVEFKGKIVDNFSFVNKADILYNPEYTGGNSGAASSDMGRLATVGTSVEDPTNEDVVTSLGNNNLGSIIDGEDRGKFSMDLFFEKGVNNLFFWERGMNSAMDVQAVDADGNLIGNLLNINARNWDNAGFRLNTMEIGNNVQKVGSRGVSLADLGVDSSLISRIRVSAEGNSFYNGPDFKVVGAAVPEPGMVMGLGALGVGLLASSRRKKADKV